MMPVGLAALAWGCISVETVIRVKADGSGTVTETVTMNPEAVANAIATAGQAGAKDKPPADFGLGPLDDAALARARTATMGEGVTFVSADAIDTKTARGLTVVYAFQDVGKLMVSQRPNTRLGLPSARPDQQIRFAFERNQSGTSVLTVRMRDPLAPPRPVASPGAKPKPDANPAAMSMARQIFQGMRLRLAVEVDGKIAKATSAWVDGGTVTLLDVDFGVLVQDEAKLNQLRAASTGGSLDDLKQILKDVPGIKINVEPEVRIEFSGN
jgi:hypothetical protein